MNRVSVIRPFTIFSLFSFWRQRQTGVRANGRKVSDEYSVEGYIIYSIRIHIIDTKFTMKGLLTDVDHISIKK